MSNNESFIDEVNEEVQRDRLFQLMRKYGWIGVVLVILLVGGTAFNEYRKAQARSAAESLGDAMLAAIENETPGLRAEALASVEVTGDAVIVRDLLRATALDEAGDTAGAAAVLTALANTPGIDPAYADLAMLKAAMLGAEPPDQRIATLQPLSQPGSPYRLLALEQIALAQVEAGNTDAALATAEDILEDAELGRGLRERAQSLIVALGGTVPEIATATGASTGPITDPDSQ